MPDTLWRPPEARHVTADSARNRFTLPAGNRLRLHNYYPPTGFDVGKTG